MLTGHAAFEGETIGEILAGVFKAEPDFRHIPAEAPEAVGRLLRRCLQKDRTRRLNSANAARIEIEEALSGPTSTPPKAVPVQSRRLPWLVAAITTLAFASTAIVYFRQQPQPEMRLEITTPSTAAPLEFALSPDGRYIVFVASGDGPQRLWLRALDKTAPQPLAGTEGADYPFWSPDSRAIAFTAGGKLKRIDIAGGSPQVLANASLTFSGAWNADGTILFNTSGAAGPLSRIAATAGESVVVTHLQECLQCLFGLELRDHWMGLLIIVYQPEEQTAQCLFFRCSARAFIKKRLDAFAYLPQFRFVFDNAGQRWKAILRTCADSSRDS